MANLDTPVSAPIWRMVISIDLTYKHLHLYFPHDRYLHLFPPELANRPGDLRNPVRGDNPWLRTYRHDKQLSRHVPLRDGTHLQWPLSPGEPSHFLVVSVNARKGRLQHLGKSQSRGIQVRCYLLDHIRIPYLNYILRRLTRTPFGSWFSSEVCGDALIGIQAERFCSKNLPNRLFLVLRDGR